MSESSFGKSEARRESWRTLVNYAGQVIRGKSVLVPVRREAYGNYIAPVVRKAGDGWYMPEHATQKAVAGDPLTAEQVAGFAEKHAPGDPTVRWAHWPVQKLAEIFSHPE